MGYVRTKDLSDMAGEDIIDSRDIIKRFEELDAERDTNLETLAEHKERITELEALKEKDDFQGNENAGPDDEIWTEKLADELVRLKGATWTAVIDPLAPDGTEYAESPDWDEDTVIEWAKLKAINDEGEGYGDWRHGETLIRDSYFEKYAQELAEDIGVIKPDLNWPYDCIDWEKAADQLKQDYSSIEIEGDTYWMRS